MINNVEDKKVEFAEKVVESFSEYMVRKQYENPFYLRIVFLIVLYDILSRINDTPSNYSEIDQEDYIDPIIDKFNTLIVG